MPGAREPDGLHGAGTRPHRTGPEHMTTADMPPVFCPIPSAIHPELALTLQRALAWLDRTGVCGDDVERAWVAGSHSAEFYARFAPEADTDRLWIAACWVYWGFAFDDACCDEGPWPSTRPPSRRWPLASNAPWKPRDCAPTPTTRTRSPCTTSANVSGPAPPPSGYAGSPTPTTPG
ncbi:protein of unknown function [Streptantibioticus cattleyicolor NRRL 8057 = DSM 46488]|nr:protein of unknown function [Streptantibioticus cattleyicolor NRRL 8057 = DSM 46488]